jgi:pimeloyl-ACP methyl ester carboxylesterase
VAALTGAFAAYVAGSFRQALANGIWGWFDDDLAFSRPWGFDLASIDVPVVVWQGGQDRMVPFAHGQWLAAHLPTARARLLSEEGHLSIAVDKFGEIIGELVASAPEVGPRGDWQSLWQSRCCYAAGRDATGRTAGLTRPAAMV